MLTFGWIQSYLSHGVACGKSQSVRFPKKHTIISKRLLPMTVPPTLMPPAWTIANFHFDFRRSSAQRLRSLFQTLSRCSFITCLVKPRRKRLWNHSRSKDNAKILRNQSKMNVCMRILFGMIFRFDRKKKSNTQTKSIKKKYIVSADSNILNVGT